ncbi:MAG: DNA polymerase I [Bacteroides sp.]|nr:DNA polymerase I [Bacteroides sp.]MCM1389809.1 DNA polymerase I [Bacteroides sp.]
MNDKVLFLLDAYALIYRAYYALIRAPRMTSKGFNTSAIFGFVNTLDELLKKHNPTHIAVCFDPAGPTFRHEAYPEYKAQRDKQPEDITLSIPYIKDIIRANGIPVVEVPGYEADDVIGTIAHMAEKEGFTTYMMTPDKDYGQLVTDSVFMYKPSIRGNEVEIRGPKEVCEKYGIHSPRQVIDLLALEGDAIDNIPGCPGVGEKTAIKLISEWGDVENLLANTDKLKGALKTKVVDNAEQIRFSKYLATICIDAPIDVNIAGLFKQKPDYEELGRIYTELEFRTFLKRLPLNEAPVEKKTDATGMGSLFDELPPLDNAKKTIADFNADYGKIELDGLREFVEMARSKRCIGVAAYATGAEDMTSVWHGIAISCGEGSARYVKIPAEIERRKEVMEAISPLFTDENLLVVSHDIKREIILLRREGIDMTAAYYDTSLAHYLLEPEMNHALPRVAAAYLDYGTLDYDGDDKIRKKGEPVPVEEEVQRICEVADVTLKLYHKLTPMVREQGFDKLMDDIELPLVRVLADMEWTGVRIDVEVLSDLSSKFTEKLKSMEEKAYELAGGKFNISSPSQVGDVLFERLKLDPNAKKTKRGAYSTTEEVLEKYRDAHPIVDIILDIRGLRKLLATYIDALPQLINPKTGKIHTTYNQTVTATGRISSAAPNLQNIPIRTEEGREIRRAFIPDKGDLFMSADYSQIELRLIADISGDKDMIEAFISDEDIHRATAAKIYHENIADVTDEQRRRAKTANFGIIYGISAFGLSQRLRIPRYEAKELIDGYFNSYPHIKEYIATAIEKAREDGYVSTMMGRKRMLPEINSRNAVVRGYAERNAVNAPIQGTAADIIKLAMVNVYRDFCREGLKTKMIMQVHDELVFNVAPGELDRVKEIVTRDMMEAYNGKVPLIVSSGVGLNWLEAH